MDYCDFNRAIFERLELPQQNPYCWELGPSNGVTQLCYNVTLVSNNCDISEWYLLGPSNSVTAIIAPTRHYIYYSRRPGRDYNIMVHREWGQVLHFQQKRRRNEKGTLPGALTNHMAAIPMEEVGETIGYMGERFFLAAHPTNRFWLTTLWLNSH